MTAKETITWMQEKEHYKGWILLANLLHNSDPDLVERAS
jgi:hypothetical protein